MPNQSQLLRRVTEYVVTHAGKDGPTCRPSAEEWIEVTPDGGLVTHRLNHAHHYGCGCSVQIKPPGGACKSCGRVSCLEHFVSCSRCGVPLCLEHARWDESRCARPVVYCERCDRSRRLRHGLSVASGWVAGLFVELDRKGP